MFNKTEVENVLEQLRITIKYFVSEAHLQMSFILEAYKQYGHEYDFYPEYPIRGKDKNDEIDLVIIDKKTKQKTFIEFKHKTKNISKQAKSIKPLIVKTINDIEFEPSNMCAQDLGRFDCWSDIERLEKYKSNKTANNCFFIFITNENLYIEKDGTDGYGNDFSIKPGDHTLKEKKWNTWSDDNNSVSDKIKDGIMAERNRKITTKEYKGKNSFSYKIFQDSDGQKYSKYWCLLLEIL